jgi:predicted AlkP superfamily pyrophosphatase or phosphodiesterase
MMRISRFNVLVIFFLLTVACIRCGKTDRPGLVVFIVVDQMREDTFDRFQDLFRHGLRFLREEGVYFSEVRHDHAYTATSSGHFAISTGRFPGKVGVTGNYLYNRENEEKRYCVEDLESSVLSGNSRACSFRNFSCTALADWVRSVSPESKVWSVSVKTHAAVPLGGQDPDGVFWFDFNSGEFITSDYYMSEYPEWFFRFTQKWYPDRYFGQTWKRILDDPALYAAKSRADDFFAEAREGTGGEPSFPHVLPEVPPENPKDYGCLEEFPWLDETTLNLARTILVEENLGKDKFTDLLMISLSMPDLIGHRYGPFSQESMDTFLRLDRMLGEFFMYMDSTIGIKNTLIVLTSDHGCTPLPEFSRTQGHEAGRIDRFLRGYDAQLNRVLAEIWGEGRYIEVVSNNSIYYDYETMAEKGISSGEIDSVLVPMILKEAWAGKVYTRRQLLGDTDLDRYGRLWRNQFHPENSGDLFVTPEAYYLIWGPFGTTHEDAHDYNRHVPFVLAGWGLEAEVVHDSVSTVDIAPTVAYLLKYPFPGDLDGEPVRF